jgi:hypothetical protein
VAGFEMLSASMSTYFKLNTTQFNFLLSYRFMQLVYDIVISSQIILLIIELLKKRKQFKGVVYSISTCGLLNSIIKLFDAVQLCVIISVLIK